MVEHECQHSVLYFQRFCVYASVHSKIIQNQMEEAFSLLQSENMDILYGKRIASALQSGDIEQIQPLSSNEISGGEEEMIYHLLISLYDVRIYSQPNRNS